MNFLIPFIAAVLQAASLTLDKVVLSMRRVSYQLYVGISFPLYLIIVFVLFLIFQPPLSTDLFTLKTAVLISIFAFIVIGMNLVYYRALDADHLSEIQTIDLLWNIPLVIYASIIFTDERNYVVIALALVASFAIVWSHWQHHHFKIRKYTTTFLLWTVFLTPFAAIIAKELLTVWHPISLQLVEHSIVALVLSPLFIRYLKRVPPKAFPLLVATNLLSAIAWILYYYSFQRFGIVQTVLLFTLQPLLVYFASLLFLKEKVHWKKVVAFLVVLGSIAIAQIISPI